MNRLSTQTSQPPSSGGPMWTWSWQLWVSVVTKLKSKARLFHYSKLNSSNIQSIHCIIIQTMHYMAVPVSRDGPETETSRSRRYIQMSQSRLGLESWRLGLGLNLSGLQPIAIFTQIYLRRFVTKTLSPHKLNRSVNYNPCRMQLNSTICTSSLWHMTSFVLA